MKKFFLIFVFFLFFFAFSPKQVLATYCGLYGCEPGEDCRNCPIDCGPCPTPPPGATGTPPPAGTQTCNICTQFTCASTGVLTSTKCCCTGTGCVTCGGNDAICSQEPEPCSYISTQCTYDNQCPPSHMKSTRCANGCFDYWECGCAGDCTPVCVNGKCEYRSGVCSTATQAPTATPIPTGVGTLMGRIWDDVNCDGLFNEANSNYIQNPAASCVGGYTNLNASVIIDGPVSRSEGPWRCNPQPYYAAINIPAGNYVAYLGALPSGWTAKTPAQNITINPNQATHQWFAVCRNGRIQGRRVGGPLGVSIPVTVKDIATYNLIKDGDPYSTGDILTRGQTYTVSTVPPPGWKAQHSLCYNSIDHTTPCTGGAYIDGNSVDVTVPTTLVGGIAYVDLYWRYVAAPCTVSLSPATQEIPLGGGRQVVDTVTIGDGSSPDAVVNNLAFSSANTAYVTVNPSSRTFPPVSYATTATGVALGSTYVRSTVTLTSGATCSCCIAGEPGCGATTTCAQVTVVTPDPWLQTKGGDVHAQADLSSPISDFMASTYFNLDLDGYPGLVSYGGSSATFGAGNVSSTGWLANSSFLPSYNFDYFYKKFGSPSTVNYPCLAGTNPCPNPPNPAANAKTIYYADPNNDVVVGGNWTIPSNAKVIVFVTKNLYIDKEIHVPVGSFLAFVVKGSINIKGGVGSKGVIGVFTGTPHVQGVYLADNLINTYYNKTTDLIDNPGKRFGSGFRLAAAGIFYGKTSVTLPRDLKDDVDTMNNANTPAETFIFRPDLVLNAPPEFWSSGISWQEVTP